MTVNRAGISQLQAMLRLIDAAVSSGHNVDYYIFLSGADYPIKDNGYIMRFLMQHDGTNFINFYPLVNGAAGDIHITRFHCVDVMACVPKPIGFCLRCCLRVVNWLLPGRQLPSGITPFRGSTSWCLHRETMVYVQHFAASLGGRRLLRFLRCAWGSDEIFFPTVVLNSPFAERCRFYQRDIKDACEPRKTENKAYLHYIDWNPLRENPAVLTMADFDALQKSEYLFARKFDEQISRELLSAIDAVVLKYPDITEPE